MAMANKAAAQQMLDKIRDGQAVFTKAPSGWMVIGPAADITPGAVVTVTKTDGTTKKVRIEALGSSGEKQGVAYTVATFADVRLAQPRTAQTFTTRLIHNSLYGRGRRGSDGASYYESTPGSGRYTVQIWD